MPVEVPSFCKNFQCPECPISIRKRVLTVAVVDLILATLPLILCTIWALIMGGFWMAGSTDRPNRLLKFGLVDIMSFSPGPDTPENPGEIVNQRLFLYSVWGIYLLFNMTDLCLSLFLLHGLRNQNVTACRIWFGFRATMVFITLILILAILCTGESFLSQLPILAYTIYRIIGLWVVHSFIRFLNVKGVSDADTEVEMP